MLFVLLTTLAIHIVVFVGKMPCEVTLLLEFASAFRTFEKSIRVAFGRRVVTWETDALHRLNTHLP